LDAACSTIILFADANLRMGGHRPAVGISQRYLVLAGSFKTTKS
jgi:hypothetical protein